jgi:hypothetical protein
MAARDQPENALSLSIAVDSLLRIREHGYNIAEIALDISVPSAYVRKPTG